MKLKRWLFVITAILALFMPANVRAAEYDNTFFNDYVSAKESTIPNFTADYYLTQDENGTGTLRVKETITVDFQQSKNEHGIVRIIPIYNQDGTHRVVSNPANLNLSITHNGTPETPNRIVTGDTAYTVYIGNPSIQVSGSHTYVLEYTFHDVITEFSEDKKNITGRDDVAVAFQELYWDTNGTAWKNPISHLTANLHLPKNALTNLNTNETSCYVGYEGAGAPGTPDSSRINAKIRCKINRTADGYTFSTENLAAGENLTFAVSFKPGTFEVIPDLDATNVALLVLEIVIGGILIAIFFFRWKTKAAANQKLYKNTFPVVQYLPPNDLTLAEGAILYAKSPKATYVATLLELAVQRKISLKSISPRRWSVILNVEPDTLDTPQRDVLDIIAYRSPLTKGGEFPIERHNATRTSQQYALDYPKSSRDMLVKKDLIKPKKLWLQGPLGGFLMVFAIIFFWFILGLATGQGNNSSLPYRSNAILVGGPVLAAVVIILLFVIIFTLVWLCVKTNTFAKYTEAGVLKARYLDGLRSYIDLAEEERLKFIQSVDGADVSTAGIVHLYEKLLPWAALFGVEKTWANELNQYYTLVDDDGQDFDRSFTSGVVNGIITSNMLKHINRTMVRSSTFVNTGGRSGTSSSFSSGSGGGGFSGGGGGGGGGGTW